MRTLETITPITVETFPERLIAAVGQKIADLEATIGQGTRADDARLRKLIAGLKKGVSRLKADQLVSATPPRSAMH